MTYDLLISTRFKHKKSLKVCRPYPGHHYSTTQVPQAKAQHAPRNNLNMINSR